MSGEDIVVRALTKVMADDPLWTDYVASVRAVKGLDTDFPEKDFDRPVGQAHLATARIRHAGIAAEPTLDNDFRKQNEFLHAAFETASATETDA